MATPTATAMKHAPSQQGRTPSQSQPGAAATPPVSTPFSAYAAHAAFSPLGPRSSPQQFKKSPATSTTLMGHPANGVVNFDSPSAAAALGALGIGGGLDLNLDNVGVGGLGGLGTLGRVDDDERARRLDVVIDILNKASKGVVSEAGLERLARRIGLECLWEDGMGSDAKSRTLIIAGSVLALDIVLSSNIVQSVSLAFPDSSDIVAKHVERAGQILLDDLKLRSHQSPLTKRLDRFATNLERLAVLDKLSVLPALNLYEAVAGIYESLQRLHQWELGKLRADPNVANKEEEFLAGTVLCTRSGRPVMHARDQVGMSLDYWKEARLVPTPTHSEPGLPPCPDKTWGIMISCAPVGGLALQPVRVSDKWISLEVEKLNLTDEEVLLTTGPVLDWQEPDNTILPAEEGPKAEPSTEVHPSLLPKLPDVTFMATFDPPVIVPHYVWDQMQHMANVPPSEFSYGTFDNLLFPIPPGSNHDPSEPRTITAAKGVPYVGPGKTLTMKTHQNTLFIYKPVYGRTLTEIPFSHPRQLVAMLPYLRQYAFLSTLLETSFGDRPGLPPVPRRVDDITVSTATARDEFAHFMADANGQETAGEGPTVKGALREPPLAVDVTLTAHPVPRLQVVFPFRDRVANVLLEVRLNGQVHVVSQNLVGDGLDEGKGKERVRSPEMLGRVLEICEDLGKWCAWIRTRL